MKKEWLLVIILLAVPVYSYSVSLPYTEDFSDNSYQNYAAEEAECNLVREPTGGWNGAGALKIFPPDQQDTYCGLGAIDGYSVRQLNVRVLIYFGPEFASHSNREDKFIIFNRNDGVTQNRAMCNIDNSWSSNDWISFSSCHNAICFWSPYEPGGTIYGNPDEYELFKIGRNDAYEEEWISVEFEADLDGGEATVFIYTQDGFRAGPHVIHEYRPGGGDFWANTDGAWNYIDMIGGYWNDWGSPHAGNYMKLSHLEIDDSYIGPPAGFVGGTPTYQCSDGSDNDGDGDTDLADGGCSSGTDNDESNCGDGACEGSETQSSCSQDCGTAQQTCTQLGGDCCTGGETCPGTTYSGASDCTGICCSQICQTSGSGGIFFDDDFESGVGSFNSDYYSSLAGHTQYTIQPNPNQDSDNPSANVLRYNFIQGNRLNDYVTQHFGDTTKTPLWQGTEGTTYDEIYVQFKLMYSNGFDWSAGNNKIMIFGTEDGNRHDASNPNPWAADYTTILAGGSGNNGFFEAEGNNKRSSSGQWFGIIPNIAGYGESNTYDIETERWYTLEVHKRLNDFGQNNGVWEFWIDGQKVAEYNDRLFRVPWTGTYGTSAGYGINWVMLSTYINDPAPQNQYMYYDDIKFSTSYIGGATSQTCAQQSGDICTTSETCPVAWLSASDSARCCPQTCQTGGGSEIIIDNSDSSFSTTAGSDPRGWWPSSYANPYGSGSIGSDVNQGSTATWMAGLSGIYEVYAWWTEGLYRPNDAEYTINHATGSDTVNVNQLQNGGQWNLLGTYSFSGSGSVVLTDASSDPGADAVCADAIKFVPSSCVPVHAADNNPCDEIISISELISYVESWKSGSVDITYLLEAVNIWKA